MWFLVHATGAWACQSTYYCFALGVVDGVGPGFLAGEVVPVETDGWCGPVEAVIVDADGVETALDLVSDSLPDLLPYRVPSGVAPGPYTLRVLGYVAADFPVEIGGGPDRGPVVDAAFTQVEARVLDEDTYYPDGCGSGSGMHWEVNATLGLDGAQGPNHLLHVQPVGSGTPFPTWMAVPAGVTEVEGVAASLVGEAAREGCITADLYDPTFEVRQLDTRCAPMQHAAGYGVPPTGPEGGCATATGSPLAVLAASAALAGRRARRRRG